MSEFEFETYTYKTEIKLGKNKISRHWTLRKDTQDELIIKEVYEQNCYKLPDDLSGKVIIDIGANIGAFAAACVDRGAEVVYCYDPYLALATKLYPNPVILTPLAVVGDFVPKTVIISKEKREGTLLTGGSNTFASSNGSYVTACPARKVLEVVTGNHPGKVIWLKLDCEGSEYEILASDLPWERIERVFGECHTLIDGKLSRDTKEIENGRFPIEPNVDSLVERLSQVGYQRINTEPNLDDRHLHIFWAYGWRKGYSEDNLLEDGELPEIYDTHGSQGSIVNAVKYAEKLEKEENKTAARTVAILTPFRNARKYLSLYFSQLSSLRTLLSEHNYSLRLIAAEGDSLDGTRERIIHHCRDLNLPLTLIDTTHGHMRWGSVEDPVRMKTMSEVMNKALDQVKESDSVVVWIMSDLKWGPETIAEMIYAAWEEEDNYHIFAPSVLLSDGSFYDTWAFRWLSGERFSLSFRENRVRNAFYEISSAGTCLVSRAKVIDQCRATDQEAVSLCACAREKGFRIAICPKWVVTHAPQSPYSILWISDAVCISGFARVAHQIFPILSENGYDLEVIALNFWGTPHNFPYLIWPASVNGLDPSGVSRLQLLLWNNREKYDAVVVLDDIWNIPRVRLAIEGVKEAAVREKIDYIPPPVISWVTVDGKNTRKEDLDSTFPIMVTEFGCSECDQAFPIPFGVDSSLFRPLNRQESRSQVVPKEIPSDAFIIGYVGTNQLRKNIKGVIEAFAAWIRSYNVENSYLYLCVGKQDDTGCDIESLIQFYELKGRVIMPIINSPLSDEVLARIYNSFDIFLSLPFGEGFGLTALEAMSCGIPCVLSDWSGYSSWTADCAMKIECSNTILTAPLNDKAYVLGGVSDKEKVVEALSKLYQIKDLRDTLSRRGRELAESVTWEKVGLDLCSQIEKVIERVAIQREEESVEEEPGNSHLLLEEIPF